jgi:hypothetical protein
MRIALGRILARYRLTVVPGSQIDAHIESTMLVPTHGLPMQIHAADGRFAASPIGGNVRELVEFDASAPIRSRPPRRPR